MSYQFPGGNGRKNYYTEKERDALTDWAQVANRQAQYLRKNKIMMKQVFKGLFFLACIIVATLLFVKYATPDELFIMTGSEYTVQFEPAENADGHEIWRCLPDGPDEDLENDCEMIGTTEGGTYQDTVPQGTRVSYIIKGYRDIEGFPREHSQSEPSEWFFVYRPIGDPGKPVIINIVVNVNVNTP